MSNHDTLHSVLTEQMSEFRDEMERVDQYAIKIGNRTSSIIRVVLTLLLIACFFLAFLVFSMAEHLGVMLGHLDNMYGQFVIMSDDMHVIARSVKHMGDNISGMPVIADNMTAMTRDMQSMLSTTAEITGDMAGMEVFTGRIHVDTAEMTHHFDNLNRAVQHIGYNVNQMSAPFP